MTLRSTDDLPPIASMKVQPTVLLPARKAIVSPESTLRYFMPGISEMVRDAASTGAALPKSAALAGGKGAHAEAMPRTQTANATRKACLVFMIVPLTLLCVLPEKIEVSPSIQCARLNDDEDALRFQVREDEAHIDRLTADCLQERPPYRLVTSAEGNSLA